MICWYTIPLENAFKKVFYLNHDKIDLEKYSEYIWNIYKFFALTNRVPEICEA